LDRDSLAAVIPSFLRTCQPYFNHLESTARSTVSQYTSTPDICTKLLDFSQQLCDRLEQLVLAFASYNLLCLNESEPNSTSHFCIGQSRLGQLKMTVFRYCKATPYLARVDTGLYKRMRWNVERLQNKPKEVADEEQNGDSKEAEAETVGDTEYGTVRMWSIGQWVQVNPNPTTDDIYDWITCEVPQAIYHRLLFLGSDEPSSSGATDYLQQLLLSLHSLHFTFNKLILKM
uniref:Si:ch211-214c7.5 n=1 Tax=Echeneis naucrates TaxID=173247 RepID=A0A665U275_ECHNA